MGNEAAYQCLEEEQQRNAADAAKNGYGWTPASNTLKIRLPLSMNPQWPMGHRHYHFRTFAGRNAIASDQGGKPLPKWKEVL